MNDPKPKQVRHFVIDISKKTVLDVTFSGDEPPERAENFLASLKYRIDDWLANSNEPVFVMGHCDDVEIKLERIEGDNKEELREKLTELARLLDNQRAKSLLKYFADELNGRCYIRDVGLGVESYYCFFCGEEKPSHRSSCISVKITEFLNND